jgi:hypothetical protein
MTEDDLFPAPIDPDTDPHAFAETGNGPIPSMRHRAKQSGHHYDGALVIKLAAPARFIFVPGQKNRPSRQATEFSCRYVSATGRSPRACGRIGA